MHNSGNVSGKNAHFEAYVEGKETFDNYVERFEFVMLSTNVVQIKRPQAQASDRHKICTF